MSLNSQTFMDRLRSLMLRTSRFDSVEGHEPESPPGKGVRAAIWAEDIEPIESGLDVVSARLVLVARITRDLTGDLDRVDPEITAAVDAVCDALAVDYDLGGTCREIDFYGHETSEKLRARAGYMEQDNKKYRAMILRVPIIVDDVWTIGGS